MSKEMAMRICFVPYAASRRLGSAEVGRLCPDPQCDLWAEEEGPKKVLGICYAEEAGVGCPKLRLPEGVLLTAETREAE